MDFDENYNPREELYNRFKKSLSQPVGDRFFDEDELVEVFDYAGDINDEYVRLEVLFCGARLYPESRILAERRAMLYMDTYDENDMRDSACIKSYLADNIDITSPLFDIARLEADMPANGNEALDFLVHQYDSFTDEEIIRLIDLAADMDCFEWVKQNMGTLKKKVRFLPSLLYEVMQEANDREDDETVIAIAEELIEMEPFTVQYWCSLFKSQARAGRENDARTTFDYAKDLAADNMPALLTLCDAAYTYAPYLYDEAIEILKRLREENPSDFTFTDCICAMLVQMGRSEQAIREVRQFLAQYPGNSRALRQLLMCNVRDSRQAVINFFNDPQCQGLDPAELDELVNSLLMRTAMLSLDALISVIAQRRELSITEIYAWAEALYTMEKYETLVEVLTPDQLDTLSTIPLKGTAAVYMYLVAMMKLGRDVEAMNVYEKIRPMYEVAIEEAPMPVRMTIRCLFSLVEKIRKHPADDKLYWEYFHMLAYGKF